MIENSQSLPFKNLSGREASSVGSVIMNVGDRDYTRRNMIKYTKGKKSTFILRKMLFQKLKEYRKRQN